MKKLIIIMLTLLTTIAYGENVLDKVVYGWIGIKGSANDITSTTSQMLHSLKLDKEASKVSKANISFHSKANKYERYASTAQGGLNGVKRVGYLFSNKKVDSNEVMRKLNKK